MLARLLSETIGLCRFRRSPADLPFNPTLAVALLVIGQVVKVLVAYQLGEPRHVVPSGAVSVLFVMAGTWLVLRLGNVSERFWQTLLALAAVNLLFDLASFPLAVAIGPLPEMVPGEPPAIPLLPGMALIVLTGWRLLVAGHVWRHALGVPIPVGVLIVVGLFLAELVLQVSLFGVAGETVDAAAGAAATGTTT